MIKEYEYCLYCGSRITDVKFSNCSSCGAPIGKVKIEFREEYKTILSIVKTPGKFGRSVVFTCHYTDGTHRRIEIDFLSSDVFIRQSVIEKTIIKELDLSLDMIQRLKPHPEFDNIFIIS